MRHGLATFGRSATKEQLRDVGNADHRHLAGHVEQDREVGDAEERARMNRRRSIRCRPRRLPNSCRWHWERSSRSERSTTRWIPLRRRCPPARVLARSLRKSPMAPPLSVRSCEPAPSVDTRICCALGILSGLVCVVCSSRTLDANATQVSHPRQGDANLDGAEQGLGQCPGRCRAAAQLRRRCREPAQRVVGELLLLRVVAADAARPAREQAVAAPRVGVVLILGCPQTLERTCSDLPTS